MTVKEAIKNDNVTYRDFFTFLFENDIGCWNDVNSTDVIHDYINSMMREGYLVSHILAAMERQRYASDDWHMALDNSMNMPEVIQSKEALANALSLSDEQLAVKYEPHEIFNSPVKHSRNEAR